MDFAPKHDWQRYDAIVEKIDRERLAGLTPEEKFARYAALFNMVHAAKPRTVNDRAVAIRRWNEKLRRRRQWVDAILMLEDRQHG